MVIMHAILFPNILSSKGHRNFEHNTGTDTKIWVRLALPLTSDMRLK